MGSVAEIPSIPGPDEILDNISMLYELSLGIGTSLNLQENCEFFVQKLMARQNLSFVAIYADLALQGLSDPSLNTNKQYSCIYICPQLSLPELDKIVTPELLLRLQAEGMVSVTTEESGQTLLPQAVHASFPGIFSSLSVCQGQMIALLINQVRQSTYSTWQLNQLQLLLDKFGRSVEACFNHESLRQATQAKIALEKKLGQAQRLESLGLMASGIAHDLGNILNPLTAYPNILESAFSEGTKERFMLSQMQGAVSKANAMMKDLLMLTRQAERCHAAIPLALPIRQYLKSASFLSLRAEEPDINCRWNLNSHSQVLADDTMVTRIVMNLVTNAFDALHGQGGVEVLVEDYDFTVPHEGYAIVPAGQYVGLTVQDNGAGIPQDALAHIFDPFFSKKKLGRSGSGLGLAVVRSIVDGLNGVIDVKTGAEGTSFIIYFPRLATRTMELANESPQGTTPEIDSISSISNGSSPSTEETVSHKITQSPTLLRQSAEQIILNGISLMPERWIHDFKKALASLMSQSIEEQIEKIPTKNKQFKKAIQSLSDAYRYDILLELISSRDIRE